MAGKHTADYNITTENPSNNNKKKKKCRNSKYDDWSTTILLIVINGVNYDWGNRNITPPRGKCPEFQEQNYRIPIDSDLSILRE